MPTDALEPPYHETAAGVAGAPARRDEIGSTARDEARPDSDVDLFFDYQEAKFGLFDLMDVKEYTSQILGFEADIMTRDSIHKVLRPRIEASALRIF